MGLNHDKMEVENIVTHFFTNGITSQNRVSFQNVFCVYNVLPITNVNTCASHLIQNVP